MKQKLRSLLLHLLFPGKIITLFLPIPAYGLLIAVFMLKKETSAFAVPVYILSAYATAVLIANSKSAFIKIKQFYDRHRIQFALRESLILNLCINGAFCIFQFVSGFQSRSEWFFANGFYYLLLCMVRMVLVHFEHRQQKQSDSHEKLLIGWTAFQICGITMLLLNGGMTVLVYRMIHMNASAQYTSLGLYAIAAYTFYRFTTALVRVITNRNRHDPLDGAIRNLNLTAANMALFSLQAAMLNAFGDDTNFQYIINTVCGVLVCALNSFGAVGMIVHAQRRKKQLQK